MTIKEIQSAIAAGKFTTEELSNLNRVVVAAIKAQRKVAGAMVKASLTEGMTVRVNHPQLAGRTFTLTQIKRTKASVRPVGEMFGGYNVPLNLIEAI